jgi:GT2 family glycosyltransferase
MSSPLIGNALELSRYVWERSGTRSWPLRRPYAPDDDSLAKIAAWAGSWTGPALTICIPTTDRLDLLIPCLASLADTCAGKPVDVVIGDTGSSAETRETCTSVGLPVVPVLGRFNFSRACNEMARAARGESFLFLNSDAQAASDWVDHALRSSDREIVGAALVYPGTRRIQHAGVDAVRSVRWLDRNAYRPPRGYRGESRVAVQNVGIGKRLDTVSALAARVMAVTGAFLLTTRAQFSALGGFDEAFDVDLQDIDYCLRGWAHGLEVVCRRDIVFSHRHAASRGRYTFSIADWQLFVDRWQAELERWSGAQAPL